MGLRAQDGEVTVRPIPHGPGLLIERAAACELHTDLAERRVGSLLLVLGCCCWCCREWVSWQFVTRAVKPTASLLSAVLLQINAKIAAVV